jgi:hypothetical protein
MKKIKKYKTSWTKIGDLFWSDEPQKTGIYCGVTKKELNNISFLEKISAKKEFYKNFKKKEV